MGMAAAVAVHAERRPQVPDISYPGSTMSRVKMPRVRLQRQRELSLMNSRPVAPACVSVRSKETYILAQYIGLLGSEVSFACHNQLATTGFQYRESGSPIVLQISRYGDTPKYADMVDRDIGDIYRHMSKYN